MSKPVILDLDNPSTIEEYDHGITQCYPRNKIDRLIKLIRRLEKPPHSDHYAITVKYLDTIKTLILEIDDLGKTIHLLHYNCEQTKVYLKILISVSEDPMIKYIESDGSKIGSIKSGEYLMYLSHCLMTYLGFQRSRLDDDSRLILSGGKIRVKLWLYLLITQRKSWYSKFGYQASNCYPSEWDIAIDDARSISLEEVVDTLRKCSKINYLTQVSYFLVDFIGGSRQTLYQFTTTHPIEDFAILTNCLMQSVFEKRGNLSFFWYDRLTKLRLANVLQVNHHVSDHCSPSGRCPMSARDVESIRQQKIDDIKS